MNLNELVNQNLNILPVVVMALSGFLLYLIKDLPLKILNFIFSQFTFTINLDGGNSQLYLNDMSQTYYNFLNLLSKVKFKISLNKIFSINYQETKSIDLINDLGIVMFFYKKNFYICKLWKIEAKGDSSNSEFSKCSVTMIGFNYDAFVSFVSEFYANTKEKENLKIWFNDEFDYQWTKFLNIQKRPIDSIALNNEFKIKILSTIKNFLKQKEWYNYHSIPYKLIIIFHGPSGTGKTSLIRSLSSYFNKDIYNIDLSEINCNQLRNLFSIKNVKNPFFLIEDFDDISSIKSRELENFEEKNTKLNLSQFLNIFDGISSLNGAVVFLTTNHLNHIDTAFLRKGRVDYIFEIGLLNDTEIKNYIKYNFPDFTKTINKTFLPITGADLQSLFLTNFENVENFIDSIPD